MCSKLLTWMMFIEATNFQALYFFPPSMIRLLPQIWLCISQSVTFKTQHNISFSGLTPEKQFLILKNWNITAVHLSGQNIFALVPVISQNSEFWNYYKKILSFVWSILNISKLFPTINAFVISKLFFLLRQNQISSLEKKMS